MQMEGKRITSFRELEVYQNTYNACIRIMQELLPNLPEYEKFDLKEQLRRSVKAIPRLIAEGYAKRHQKSGFQKYLDDAMAECNETIVGLEMCRDIYKKHIQVFPIDEYIDLYDKAGRQLYKLREAWFNFKAEQRNRSSK